MCNIYAGRQSRQAGRQAVQSRQEAILLNFNTS